MFRGGQTNPYDEIVAKATDENQTSENWEVILALCDKINEEGEQGARNVIAAVLKRLTHRNANVQLYALALVESMSKNCGIDLHREMASRSFTQALEKLINDRATHDKVKKRALSLVAMWTSEFEKDPSLGIMEECFNNLKAKNYKFETPQEAPPPDVDDAVRRREEEELQRVLELSVRDKGGRTQWSEYSAFAPTSSGPSASSAVPTTPAPSGPSNARPSTQSTYAPPPASSGYVPARSPSPKVPSSSSSYTAPTQLPYATPAPQNYAAQPMPTSTTPAPQHPQEATASIVTRVRALHNFESTEPGELAFEKGDIIKVVDRGYKDWWRGQLKGRTGIFPVNYVESLPEPTAAQLAKEAEQEAAVFSQAANVDKLLTMLREFDPATDNLADDDEIQELYRNSMGLRTKIVKLIDKYSQKRADLVSMNESFVKAKSIYERMMEQSLARFDVPDGRPAFHAQYSSYNQAAPPAGPQSLGWNPAVYEQPGYNAYPAPHQAYPPGHEGTYPSINQAQQGPPVQHPGQSYGQPYGPPQPGQPPLGQPQQYGPPTPVPGQFGPQPTPTPAPHAQQHAYGAPQTAGAATPHGQPPYAQPQNYPQGQPQGQPQPQQPQQPPVQAQPHAQAQPVLAQSQPQHQAPQSGPPYVYDPNTTYSDPNVQAWAQYYSQGGTDPTGSVYFISVPGVKEGPPVAGAPPPQQDAVQAHTQAQLQPAHPGQHQPQPGQEPSPVVGYTQQAPYTIAGTPGPQGQASQSPQQPGGYPGLGHPNSPGSTFAPNSPQRTTSFGAQQTTPAAAPGPYASGTYGNTTGAVYPPAGYEGAPQSPHAASWQGQHQALPMNMDAMSISGDDGGGVQRHSSIASDAGLR